MQTFTIIALLIAAICFALGALGAPSRAPLTWIPLGLLSWVLVPLVVAIRAA